jgi:hypothetical protein
VLPVLTNLLEDLFGSHVVIKNRQRIASSRGGRSSPESAYAKLAKVPSESQLGEGSGFHKFHQLQTYIDTITKSPDIELRYNDCSQSSSSVV